MTYIKAFLLFWYDFIVGDDWIVAAGVVASLAMTRELVTRNVDAWWLLPVAVVVLLALSLGRAARRVPR